MTDDDLGIQVFKWHVTGNIIFQYLACRGLNASRSCLGRSGLKADASDHWLEGLFDFVLAAVTAGTYRVPFLHLNKARMVPQLPNASIGTRICDHLLSRKI